MSSYLPESIAWTNAKTLPKITWQHLWGLKGLLRHEMLIIKME